ncbi:MAG: glycosyltransferase family 39 protein, partial [Deltaproteobacteria bacterium]|nr:glycosyltransferase family 39 protein [Deltaproteobacteria bacterium]
MIYEIPTSHKDKLTSDDVFFFEGLSALLQPISPWGKFETRHFLNALVGLIGIIGCWKTARYLRGPQGAFYSAAFLAAMPIYYGHMFFNSKDIPFAAGYIWSLYFIIRIYELLTTGLKKSFCL